MEASRRRLGRAEQASQNRNAVLAVAGEVFRDRGYIGATIDAIAEAAGFSKGVVYSQFASKADLFLTLLEDRIEQRIVANREAVARSEDQLGAQHDVFLEAILTSRSDPGWRLAVIEFRVTAARDEALQRRYRAAHQRTVDQLSEIIRLRIERAGVEPVLSPSALATALLALDVGTTLEDQVRTAPLSDAEAALLMMRLAIGSDLQGSEVLP